MPDGTCETASTPFSRSLASSGKSFSHSFLVRSSDRQERLVAFVRRVVLLDEFADVDVVLPPPGVTRARRLLSASFP